ncbi:MAG TPA: glycosyltransferase 87 family protein [Candidatus Paceibacterota bacterium]
MRNKLLIVALVVLGSALFHGLGLKIGGERILPWHIAYSDMPAFSERALAPGFAYLNKKIEYPVITGLIIDITGKVGRNVPGYFIVNALLLIGFAVASTYLLQRLTEHYPDRSGSQDNVWRYWIFAPSLLMFGVYNWDLVAVFFSICALYAMAKNKDYWAAIWIAIGFSTKFFPALFFLPLLLKQDNWKKIGYLIGIFIAVTLVINSYFILNAFDNWYYFFELNRTRNSNIDSIWTTIRFLFSPYLESVPRVNALSLVTFSGLYGWLMWRFRKADTVKLCFLSVLAFLLTNKVFSPQYLLWLLPFFVIFSVPKIKWFYALEGANIVSTFIVLRWFLIERNVAYFYWSAPLVIIRHIILISVFIYVDRLILPIKKPAD